MFYLKGCFIATLFYFMYVMKEFVNEMAKLTPDEIMERVSRFVNNSNDIVSINNGECTLGSITLTPELLKWLLLTIYNINNNE